MPRPSINGRRVHVMLTDPQIKYLTGMSRRTGLTQSDLIRRAVDAQVAKDKKARQK